MRNVHNGRKDKILRGHPEGDVQGLLEYNGERGKKDEDKLHLLSYHVRTVGISIAGLGDDVMRILCLNCGQQHRTRRKNIETIKCPGCNRMITNVMALKPIAYIVMEETKMRYAR